MERRNQKHHFSPKTRLYEVLPARFLSIPCKLVKILNRYAKISADIKNLFVITSTTKQISIVNSAAMIQLKLNYPLILPAAGLFKYM